MRAQLIAALIVLLCSTATSRAQERPGPSLTDSPTVQKAGNAFTGIFDGPVRPVFKGVGSGGGIGVGLRYDLPTFAGWQTSSTALVTMRRYWSLQLDTHYERDRLRIDGYARLREMSQMNFFGLGAGSRRDDRTNFMLRDPLVGAVARLQLTPELSVGGRVEEVWPSVGRGRSSRFPSLEERFDESAAPGLLAQPRFGRYQTFVDVDLPAGPGEALHQGAKYRVAYALIDDRGTDRFSFGRFDAEAQQRFAMPIALHRLTLHAWTSLSNIPDGHDVPFYLQPTLGAKPQMLSPHEDLLGADDTRATLRAYRNLRFRDRNLVLFQAEYRIPVYGPVDATVFAEAGTVAPRPSALSLGDLKRSYGFSVSMMRKSTAAARVDVAFGGGEGTRLIFSVGKSLR